MNEPSLSQTISLLSPTSQEPIGQVSMQWSLDTRQVVILDLKTRCDEIAVTCIAGALVNILKESLSSTYGSAVCWPHHADHSLSVILKAAGFTQAGLFMQRKAFSEDGQVAFRDLDEAQLNHYLNTHAHKMAAIAAEFHHHNVDMVYAKIREDYEKRFSVGLISDEERIQCIVDNKNGNQVGILWTSLHQEGAVRASFIEEIEIYEESRNRGYGQKAVRAIGNVSYGRRIDVLSLFVHPDNIPACNLYRKLGFQPGRFEFVYKKPR